VRADGDDLLVEVGQDLSSFVPACIDAGEDKPLRVI
jgi:hypothetical protein